MKTFDEIYELEKDNLKNIENFRKKQYKRLRKTIIIGFILFVIAEAIVSFIAIYIINFWQLIPFVGLMLFILFLLSRQTLISKYVQTVKQSMIQRLFRYLKQPFSYIPKQFVDKSKFDDSNFIRKYKTYTGEDFFSYRSKKLAFEMSDLRINDNSGKIPISHFKGTFWVIDTDIKFNGQTVVLPDTLEKNMGELGRRFQSLNVFRNQLIKIGNDEFEEEFVIYTTDQDEAKSILNGSLLHYILYFAKNKNYRVFLSFSKSKIYFGLSDKEIDFLEINIKTKINSALLKKYYDQIALKIEIAEKIKTLIRDNVSETVNKEVE